MLHLRPVGKREGVLYVNAQIANGALDLRVAEEDLHGAQVACLLINDGRLGSVQRMSAIIRRAQADRSHPLINKPSILPSTDMIGVIEPARKDKLVKRAASALKPGQNAAASRLEQFELNGSAGLLMDDDGA